MKKHFFLNSLLLLGLMMSGWKHSKLTGCWLILADQWLFVNDRENEPPDFEPKVVTLELVSQAIRYALGNDWDADWSAGRLP